MASKHTSTTSSPRNWAGNNRRASGAVCFRAASAMLGLHLHDRLLALLDRRQCHATFTAMGERGDLLRHLLPDID